MAHIVLNPYSKHNTLCTLLASFPGPAQFFVACSLESLVCDLTVSDVGEERWHKGISCVWTHLESEQQEELRYHVPYHTNPASRG